MLLRRILVSETYEIEDIKFYAPLTSQNNHFTISGGTLAINEYTSNGWKYGNANAWTWIDNDLSYQTGNVRVEFDVVSISSDSTSLIMYFENSSEQRVYVSMGSSQYGINGSSQSRTFASGTYAIEYTSNSLKLYYNDNLLNTVSHSNGEGVKLRIGTGTNRWVQIKNLKVL